MVGGLEDGRECSELPQTTAAAGNGPSVRINRRSTMLERNRLPNVEEIAAMSPDEAEATLVAATSVLPLLVAKAREPRSSDGPDWMSVGEAARMTGMTRFFFYDHWKELPFCRKIGRSVKINRKGLKQWLESKKAA